MNNRKIIQIATCGHNENQLTQSEFTIFALCDDGTLWFASNRDVYDDRGWSAVNPIPQVNP